MTDTTHTLTRDLHTDLGTFTPGHPVHIIRRSRGRRAVICVVHTDRCHGATIPSRHLQRVP